MECLEFGFSKAEMDPLLDWFENYGFSVVAEPLEEDSVDEEEFKEAAKQCSAILITGNGKRFPQDPCIVGTTEFVELYRGESMKSCCNRRLSFSMSEGKNRLSGDRDPAL